MEGGRTINYSEVNTFLLVAGLVGGVFLGTFVAALLWRLTATVTSLIIEFSRFLDWQAGDAHQSPADRKEVP